MEKGSLYFTIGCPRSGKSTYADNWVKHETKRVILSGDSFRKAVHGHSFIKIAEELVWTHLSVAAKALLNRGFDVLIDETNSTLTSLYKIVTIDIDAQPIWIDTPVEVCLERAIATGKPYLEAPIRRIAKQIEELKAGWPQNFESLKEKIRNSGDIEVVQ